MSIGKTAGFPALLVPGPVRVQLVAALLLGGLDVAGATSGDRIDLAVDGWGGLLGAQGWSELPDVGGRGGAGQR